MSAVRRYDWETIRAEYEAGATMGDLSRRHGADKAAISRRARKEGWTQDVSGAVDRLADAKVNGIVNTVDPQKKAEALDRAAERKAAVIHEQRDVWSCFPEKILAALDARDFDELKRLKIASETFLNVQNGTRKAWGITDKTEAEVSGGLNVVWGGKP